MFNYYFYNKTNWQMLSHINIKMGDDLMPYGVEFRDWGSTSDGQGFKYFYDAKQDAYQLCSKNEHSLKRNVNEWTDVDYSSCTDDNLPLPTLLETCTMDVMFPEWSVETYYKNYLYNFTASTFVNGKKIILCSVLLDRHNALAVKGVKKTASTRFYESIRLVIPDPWDIAYSEYWKDFRHDVCGEPLDINNTGSIITIELHPLSIANDGSYMPFSHAAGGMNVMTLSNHGNDYMKARMALRNDENGLRITASVIYNNEYGDDFEDYLRETYFFVGDNNIRSDWHLYLKDNTELYADVAMTVDPETPSLAYAYGDELGVNSWSYFKEGLSMKCIGDFFISENEDPFLTLVSNELPVTKEVFSMIAVDDALNGLRLINLTDIENMNIYEIRAVNKIKTEVVNVQRPESYSSIIKPVFIKSTPVSAISIKSGVKQTIGVNLAKYKSMVDVFYLRLAGIDFPEIARQGDIVMFTVDSIELEDTDADGEALILDQDKNLVTTGKYIKS